jgi:hypothetical protein
MVSFCILFLVGDYDEAVVHAKTVDKDRGQFAISPTNRDGCVSEAYGCYKDWADNEQHPPPQMHPTGKQREMLAHYKKQSLLDEEQQNNRTLFHFVKTWYSGCMTFEARHIR